MEITKTIQPGDMGSKLLFEQYGESLVCVRYRVDRLKRKRYKTVEIIVEEKPLLGSRQVTMAWIKVGYAEAKLRQQVKEVGGLWRADDKVWELPYDTVKRMRLTSRVTKRYLKKDV